MPSAYQALCKLAADRGLHVELRAHPRGSKIHDTAPVVERLRVVDAKKAALVDLRATLDGLEGTATRALDQLRGV